MGLSFSCPFAPSSDLEQSIESVVVKSINFGGVDGEKTPVRSVSFKGEDAEPRILQSIGSGRMLVEGSVIFWTEEAEMRDSIKSHCEDKSESITSTNSKRKDIFSLAFGSDAMNGSVLSSPALDPCKPKHEAAIKLQKVYKSFRTRRKLADCAVLIEQSWWKLLDFAELKHSSISFFDLEKNETAISRWSRARTRAAKVGKGLSKNGKARKLALQHWLEAIDPRHRYGHNLHFYYNKWLHSQSKEPFFYWLDIGEGKEINIVDKCPRCKLQQQCIKYLGPMERKAYEVAVENGKFFYKETGELLDTTGEPKGVKWIFVLSTCKSLYVGKKKKGTFQHSSFLAGGAALAAGRLVVEKGILKAVWPHSGHYRPTPENFQDYISFLRENDVDLADVKLDSVDEERSVRKKENVYLRSNTSEDDLAENDSLHTEDKDNEDSAPDGISLTRENSAAMLEAYKSKQLHSFGRKLTTLEIPSKDDIFERLKSQNHVVEANSDNFLLEYPSDGDETTEELFASGESHNGANQNLPAEELDETKEEIIPKESILQRINSHKEMKSYQLGKQLSCKWSTGAGPRIGCLRDYPSGLQSHALEQANLSPRSIHALRLDLPSRSSTPTSFSSEMPAPCSASPGNLSHRISLHSAIQASPLSKGTSTASAPKLP